MTSIGRRPPPGTPDFAKLQWENVRCAMADFVRWAKAFYSSIPGGWKNTTPKTVLVGGTPSAGTEDGSWMAADAQLVIAGGVPNSLGDAEASGGSTAAADLLHIHARRAGVKPNGGAVVIERDINFLNTTSVTWTATLDAPNNEVEVQATVNDEDAFLWALVL